MTSDRIRRQAALTSLRDTVGLWYVDQVGADALVRAACTLLVAGFDGPSLCMLAAVSVKNADNEVPEYLEAALHEVGLDFHERDTPAAREAGLRAMAAQTLSHAVTPRKLAGWAHRTFGHDTLEPAERPAELDDASPPDDPHSGAAPTDEQGARLQRFLSWSAVRYRNHRPRCRTAATAA
ncbi:hypothetical protein [Amycolatopsis sp. YIM 10]|uniref:hypothetical protein n=1 Tax=Amycolatopsis sp. YIM 10 TaxID=2653857 RepID=UPI00129074B2|nr:hypothetical protein [Amycolatopsis sp. YIM 10]QFU90114.1 hypothetical protein YIM_24685 [Amycolatopsis sp. YIM 10]